MEYLKNILIKQWYQEEAYARIWFSVLKPFEWLFTKIVKLRKYCYDKNYFGKYKAKVPVIVVGNLTVGGTGKTPLVIYLAQMLSEHGYRPGIVTRGYKGQINSVILVSRYSDPKVVSDEAVLLATRSKCPVMVAKKRAIGVKHLVRHNKVDVILCDDGLQHYALERDIEIVVIDGKRRFGNGHSLPMGPLREPVSRLATVDLIVVNGQPQSEHELAMQLITQQVYSLKYPERSLSLQNFSKTKVHAVAGIGNPDKFFQSLRDAGLDVIPHAFPDHHNFSQIDVAFQDAYPVLMTEKDAVKCKHFANDKHWAVAVSANLANGFAPKILQLVKEAKENIGNVG